MKIKACPYHVRVSTVVWVLPLAGAHVSRTPRRRRRRFPPPRARLRIMRAQSSGRTRVVSRWRSGGKRDIREIHAAPVAAAESTPAYCRVTGLLDPEIAFEISLPERWNGRFYMFGNGGLAGESLEDPFRTAQRNGALQMGFRCCANQHRSRCPQGARGSFVMSNPRKALDYAYRAVNLTTTTAKEMTRRYYGKLFQGRTGTRVPMAGARD